MTPGDSRPGSASPLPGRTHQAAELLKMADAQLAAWLGELKGDDQAPQIVRLQQNVRSIIDQLQPAAQDRRQDRRALISKMAADLRRYEATGSEADAIRSLFGRGYGYGDIIALIDEALFEAKQAITAETFARSR